MGGKKHKSKKKKRWEDEAFPVREEGYGFPDYGPALDAQHAPSGESKSSKSSSTPQSDGAPEGAHNAERDEAQDVEREASKASEAEARTWQLAERYLNTLETQLQTKDQQLHAMNERLQDAFDMQRALALLIKAYERRTGLLADAVWDEVPEEALGKEPGESSGSGPSPGSGPSAAADQAAGNRTQEAQPSPANTAKEPAAHSGGAFTQWLRQTGAKPSSNQDG